MERLDTHEKLGLAKSTAALDNLIRILKIKRNNVKLMDFFAVPFKTIVLRLYELDYITDNQAHEFLQIPDSDTDNGVLTI